MNDLASQIQRLIAPLVSRVKSIVGSGWVREVDDSSALQRVTVALPGGDLAPMERVQNYGFSSVPKAGAQAVVVSVGSKRSELLAVAVDDRRVRPLNLQPGDVVMYDDQGSVVQFGREGRLTLNAAGTLVLQCGQNSITLSPTGIVFKGPVDFQQ